MSGFFRSVTFSLLASLAACTSAPSDRHIAAGEDDDVGLGGTGLLAAPDSGLGGTGIIGEITGFGSVFVNGVEIEYDSSTPFTINGEVAKQQPLVVGDVVEVLTLDDAQHTRAQLINLRHELIGKVESVDPKTFSFSVLGQSVIQAINKTLPEPGTNVAVAGFRIDDKTILSTRVTVSAVQQNLLRKSAILPFKEKTSRWRVQRYVKNGRVSFQLEGMTQTLSVKDESDELLSRRLGIKVLHVHKTSANKLVLDQAQELSDLPKGKRLSAPVQLPNKIMKSPMGSNPGAMPGSGAGSGPGGGYKQNQPRRY